MPVFVRLLDCPVVPWKNGAGTTRELFRIPLAQTKDFKLRISVAEVNQTSEFSLFPGVNRSLLLLEGSDMSLEFANGRRELLQALKNIIHFQGDEAITGRPLSGPCTDFNLMSLGENYLLELRHFQKDEVLKIDGVLGTFIYQARGLVSFGPTKISSQTLWVISQEVLELTILDETTLIYISPLL